MTLAESTHASHNEKSKIVYFLNKYNRGIDIGIGIGY